MSSKLIPQISKALDYLYAEQLDWGEFVNYSLIPGQSTVPVYNSIPFITTFILYSLNLMRNDKRAERIIKKGIKFLLKNREGYFWRYLPGLSLDLDTTSCVLSILKIYGFEQERNLPEKFLKYRNPNSNLFETWIENPPAIQNDTDPIVNANILLYYGLKNRSNMVPEVVEFLLNESNNIHCQNSQIWYSSPYIFSYSISRCYSMGKIEKLSLIKENLIEYLLFTQNNDGSWGNALESAFALNTLLNYQYKKSEVSKGIEYLLDKQNKDGSWDREFFYPIGGDGSNELTTALCIEAIFNYSKQFLMGVENV